MLYSVTISVFIHAKKHLMNFMFLMTNKRCLRNLKRISLDCFGNGDIPRRDDYLCKLKNSRRALLKHLPKKINLEIVSLFIKSNSSDGAQLVEEYFCLSIAYRRDPE